MSSTIVSARSLFFQKELHEDLIEVKSIFLFASLRTETSGLLRLRLLIPNGGYCFTMVVTALRWWLLLYVCAYSFSIRILLFYIFFILERERLSGRKSHPDPGIKRNLNFPLWCRMVVEGILRAILNIVWVSDGLLMEYSWNSRRFDQIIIRAYICGE